MTDTITQNIREEVVWQLSRAGWPTLAEDVQAGLPLDTALERIVNIGREFEEDTEEARAILSSALMQQPGRCPACGTTNVMVTPLRVRCGECDFRHVGDCAPAVLIYGEESNDG